MRAVSSDNSLRYKCKSNALFPLLALLLGLGWMAVMTPLSVPDEEYHYRTAYCLSNYLLGQGSEPLLGWQGYFDFTGFLGHFNVSSGYERVARDLTTPMVRGELIPVTAAALGLPLRPRSPIPAWIPCAVMALIHCDAFRFIVLYTLAH